MQSSLLFEADIAAASPRGLLKGSAAAFGQGRKKEKKREEELGKEKRSEFFFFLFPFVVAAHNHFCKNALNKK